MCQIKKNCYWLRLQVLIACLAISVMYTLLG